LNVKVKGQGHQRQKREEKKLLSHAAPEWTNISGIAERICAKFTGKTSLVARSDEFQGQGQRSKFKVAKTQKTRFSLPSLPQRRNGTRSLQMT